MEKTNKSSLKSSLVKLLEPQVIRVCTGSPSRPCRAIEVKCGDNSKMLVSSRDYSAKSLIEAGHTFTHGIISRQCFIKYLYHDAGYSLEEASKEADLLKFEYDECPR
jgi:hypothetical protein